jgi:hypothetical protein
VLFYPTTIIFYHPLTGDILCLPQVHTRLHGLTASRLTYEQVKSRLLLDIVVPEGMSIPKRLAGKDQALVEQTNTLAVLDPDLELHNSVRGLDLVPPSDR